MSEFHTPFDVLAQDFLTTWQNAHGTQTGQAKILSDTDHLAVLIEGSFSQAERSLAADQNGRELLRQYALELLAQVQDEMISRIEELLNRRIGSNDVSVNPEMDQILFVFKFEDIEVTKL